MGFLNWLLRNGPGSPGSTAKTYVKEYKKMSSGTHDEEWEGIFFALFVERYLVNQRFGFPGGSILNQADAKEVVAYSDGDLALFVFYMMLLETSKFRNNIGNTFNEVTSVIFEVIKDEAPSTLKYDLQTFRIKASDL